ncbi:MAG TPA: glycosyltransferase family 2 protein [Ferruginibacter sp.]|nr:glycosyltransferase family 2 protein [Ferruginibacter sp.]HRE63865.1 glycosyltransferase family 2 protein [Ferruginibacter sp.]
MKLSVIFTTYNSPDWLQKTVWGYWHQSFTDFEIIIADDGSGEETKSLITQLQSQSPVPIRHVWHEDAGFRKCEILNKAIVAAQTDYLVFTDGDCIPHKDFLKVHDEEKKSGYFLSGGYFKLPMNISKLITQEDIANGRCFELKWLKQQGLPSSFKNTKLFFNKGFASVMNTVTPTNASWNGHNASGWKKDIIAVNGYNEEMKYGALDRELGERLMNNGIKPKQIRYSAVCLHLDHSRSYKNQKDIDHNKAIREKVKKEKITRAAVGIDKYI